MAKFKPKYTTDESIIPYEDGAMIVDTENHVIRFDLNGSMEKYSQTIVDADFTSGVFRPKMNTYYRYIGQNTVQYTYGIIYFYDGSNFIAITGGGSQGTIDYDELEHKPIINADLTTAAKENGKYYLHTGATVGELVTGVIYYFTNNKLIPLISEGTKSYNELEDKPVINIDLTNASGLVAHSYYKHSGATTATYTQGVIYYYDGNAFVAITGKDEDTKNYNSLINTPILNVDLNTYSDLVENSYYKHVGDTTATYTHGLMYLYKDGALAEVGATPKNVLITDPQVLTDEQKEQVWTNLGLINAEEVEF